MSSENFRISSAVELNIFTFKVEDRDVYKVYKTKTTGENNKITFDINISRRPKTHDETQHNLYINLRPEFGGSASVRTLKTQVTLTFLGEENKREKVHYNTTFTEEIDKLHINYDGSILNDYFNNSPQNSYRRRCSSSPIDTGKGLIVHCDIRFVELPAEYNSEETISQLAMDFENLLTSGDLSDIVFIISEKEIKAHRSILAARSIVFSAMFKSGMKESKENIVKIEDINHNAFFEMLRFIYCGKLKVSNSYEDLKDLFIAADKYQLNKLKSICEESLAFCVDDENATECLVLSSLHNSNLLKEFVVKFIVHNAEKITKSESWQSMFVLYPQFFLEVVIAIAKVAKPICLLKPI